MEARVNTNIWYQPLSDAQKEFLCGLDLSANRRAREEQKNIALYLGKKYLHGSKDTPKDAVRARKFFAIAEYQPTPEEEATLNRVNLNGFYKWFWRLNDLRLKFVFSNSALSLVGKAFWRRIYSVAGFGYALRLLIDLAVCLHSALRTDVSEEHAKLSFWERFKLELKEGGRFNRIANDILWFPINLLGFVLGGAVAIGLNLAGFCNDIISIVVTQFSNDSPGAKALAAIDKALENEVNPKTHKTLEHYKRTAEKQLTKDRAFSIYIVLSVACVLTGAALTMFPATLFLGVILLGAGNVMLFAPDLYQKSKLLVQKWPAIKATCARAMQNCGDFFAHIRQRLFPRPILTPKDPLADQMMQQEYPQGEQGCDKKEEASLPEDALAATHSASTTAMPEVKYDPKLTTNEAAPCLQSDLEKIPLSQIAYNETHSPKPSPSSRKAGMPPAEPSNDDVMVGQTFYPKSTTASIKKGLGQVVAIVQDSDCRQTFIAHSMDSAKPAQERQLSAQDPSCIQFFLKPKSNTPEAPPAQLSRYCS